jgi:RNA polymerase sigma-70 factor (ECF subfamily)
MILDFGARRFEDTVRAYSAQLYRYAYWLTRDRFVAEDLVQETFARAWASRGKLRDSAATRSWLVTILRNEHARLYERKRPEFSDESPEDLPLPHRLTASSELEVEQLLAILPLSLREPLVLQVLGGFSCAEIAGMLGTSEGAVMTRLTRARQALRHHLDAIENPRTAP